MHTQYSLSSIISLLIQEEITQNRNTILKDTLLYNGLDYPQNVTRLLLWVSSKQVVPSQGVETKVM